MAKSNMASSVRKNLIDGMMENYEGYGRQDLGNELYDLLTTVYPDSTWLIFLTDETVGGATSCGPNCVVVEKIDGMNTVVLAWENSDQSVYKLVWTEDYVAEDDPRSAEQIAQESTQEDALLRLSFVSNHAPHMVYNEFETKALSEIRDHGDLKQYTLMVKLFPEDDFDDLDIEELDQALLNEDFVPGDYTAGVKFDEELAESAIEESFLLFEEDYA